MTAYLRACEHLQTRPKHWLVTGVAGFIGSHLLEELLKLNQRVVGLDNLAVGKRENLDYVRQTVSTRQWEVFQFLEGDILDGSAVKQACAGVDFVLHQAALGSVPKSIAEPEAFHKTNVTGFLKVLAQSKEEKVKRFVYASSSAVYGDDAALPKVEANIGRPLSPYAATKHMNEIYAQVFALAYGFPAIGLRYFNVFGPRQDPSGAYAAVIPRWLEAMLRSQPVVINGDGETSRDFCFVKDVVQANILAALAPDTATNAVYNVGLGEQTSLNQLYARLAASILGKNYPKPVYQQFRPGDIRHSRADIGKARRLLGYEPSLTVGEGLDITANWHRRNYDLAVEAAHR